jgi:hypothetical protein
MATKANPGKFDCYAKLELHEPHFVLRGKDPIGGYLVDIWAALRCGKKDVAIRLVNLAAKHLNEINKPLLSEREEKISEACHCAVKMREWSASKLPPEEPSKLWTPGPPYTPPPIPVRQPEEIIQEEDPGWPYSC